jgi:O-antigen/teichoic acid export membrane protein
LVIEDYGRTLIVINLVNFLINFLSFRVDDLIFRFFPEFSERGDIGGLRTLYFVGIGLSVCIGLLLNLSVFLLAPWISENIYHDAGVALPFQIYSFTALLWASEGFSISILRMKDRFVAVILPKVIGTLTSVILYFIYFHFSDTYSIAIVVAILGLEVGIQAFIPLLQALKEISPYLFLKDYPLAQSLKKHHRNLFRVTFNTNIYGYLYKLNGPPGDVFLLGIFSSPTQVAIYNVAQQIIRVALVLQNNIQVSLTPEIVSLWARGKLKQLYNFLFRFFTTSLAVGCIGIIIGLILARTVVLLISSNEYIDAVPVIYVLILKVYLTFSTIPFYSLALSMDIVQKRNLALFIQLILTAIFVIFSLDALKMAFIQLLGAILVLVICDLYIFINLKQVSCQDDPA